MADNDNRLESKNKVLQSLDLYANDLLNVSKIIGNEYAASVRPRELEITTSDVTSGTAGDLLLKAGLTTDESGNSGSVRVSAGSSEEDNSFSSLVLNPDGTAFFQETEDLTEEAARINLTGCITGQSTDTAGVVNIIGQSQVNIGEGQEDSFASLGNRIQLKEETRGNTQVSVLTVDTAEETHSVGTEFKVQNNLDPEHATSVFKVQAEDTDLSSDIGTGYRHEGIQAESNYIDIHAINGLKVSNDRADNYLSLTRDDSDPLNSAYLISGYSDDIQLKADNEIKVFTPKNLNDTSRFVTLSSADSDSSPGLGVQNDYSDIQAKEQLTVYNNENNSLTLTNTTSGNTITGTAQLKTTEGTITGTSFIKIQTPDGTAGTNTHIVLDESGSKKLDIQSTNGLNTKVLAGDSTETVALGDKTITATAGDIDLTADAGHIKLQSQTTSNYLTLNRTNDTLRANNQTATINSTGTLILENNPGTTAPESPSTNYIKLFNNDDIDIKAGDITETGTTSITLKADDDSNKIVLASLDDSLTATNALETHNTENEFKILVPSTASINNIQSDNFTATGTILDIVATTVNNQTSTETKLSSDSINIASMGNVRSQSKRNLYLAAGLGYNSSNPDVLNNNEILIALKDIESENSIRLSQTKDSKHDVLEVRNSYTRVNTSNYDLTASNNLKIQSSSHGAGGHDRHAAFELDANPTTATVKLNDLKVNQSIKLGNTVTGDTTGLDSVSSVPAGTASVTVAGAISKLGLTGADDNLAVQLGGLKLGDNVSAGSAAASETLLEVEHANVTGYTRVNNLDITGEIRIGAVASASASASSGLEKADSSTIGVDFSNFSTVTDDNHAASTSDLIVNVQDFSLHATETGTISTGSALDIDSTGALTVDSDASISIGTAQDKPVTINASNLTVTGNGTQTNNLQITSNSATGNYTTAGQSYIQSDVMKVESDFYGNNIHMYWDAATGSLVFAAVAAANS